MVPITGAAKALAKVYAIRNRPASAFVPPSSRMRSGMAGRSWKAEKKVMNAYAHNMAKRGVNSGSRAGTADDIGRRILPAGHRVQRGVIIKRADKYGFCSGVRIADL